MTSLAYKAPERISSEDLAKGAKTNPGLIRRLLSKLAKVDLIECQKGKNGGTTLKKPAHKIGLDEIFDAITDSSLFAGFDKEPFEPCPISCQIGQILTDVFQEIEVPMKIKMSKIKLSQLLDRVDIKKE